MEPRLLHPRALLALSVLAHCEEVRAPVIGQDATGADAVIQAGRDLDKQERALRRSAIEALERQLVDDTHARELEGMMFFAEASVGLSPVTEDSAEPQPDE